jgi:hypothetical protein
MGLPKALPWHAMFLALCIFGASLPVGAEESAPIPLWVIGENGRFGYINRSGQVVIAPRFEKAESFSEGFAAVRYRGKWGFVDTRGRTVTRARFGWAMDLREGMAQVEKNGKHGYINPTGDLVIPYLFHGHRMEGFSEGRALVVDGGKYGYIDESGSMVIPPEYWLAWGFHQGLARVQTGDAKWILIDQKGKAVSRHGFDYIDDFHDGFARVRVFRDYGFVGPDGNLSIPMKFTAALPFSEGLSAVYVRGSHRQLPVEDPMRRFDPMSPLFLYLTLPFSREKVPRMGGGQGWGYIDKEGAFVISPGFDYVGSFRDGLAEVRKGRFHGYIDKEGEFVWKMVEKESRIPQ